MTYDFIRGFGVSFTYTNMLQKKMAFVKRSFTTLLKSRHVLNLTGGRVAGHGGAAEVLGMKRTTLQARMRRLGIKP
jgi:transcriptional regulator with GAF, ATPase, and Fis domain